MKQAELDMAVDPEAAAAAEAARQAAEEEAAKRKAEEERKAALEAKMNAVVVQPAAKPGERCACRATAIGAAQAHPLPTSPVRRAVQYVRSGC